jgi:hypothetical protein
MTHLKNSFALSLLITFLAFAGCGEDPVDPAAAALNQRLDELMNSGSAWGLGSTGRVIKDDIDVTNQFAGFKLTIGNKTYTTQNSLSHVWKASGSWDFQNGNRDKIVRDDAVVIAVTHSNGKLTLTLTANGKSGGRVNSVVGEYEFQLVGE